MVVVYNHTMTLAASLRSSVYDTHLVRVAVAVTAAFSTSLETDRQTVLDHSSRDN